MLIRRAGLSSVRRSLASAAVCTALGERLAYQRDWAVGPTGPGQLRIRVAAAGVNFADLLKTRGQYQEKADPPFVPGNELAGEVCEVGDAVDGYAVGDRVVCLNRGGAYATECVADAASCLKLPADKPALDLCEAAALLVNYGTAHLALTTRGHLQSGETVLVTAAAGGVGLATVELARKLGAGKIVAAAGSESKLAIASEKGADASCGIDYSSMDGKAFRAAIKEATGKGGVDVVVDMAGGELLEPAVRSLSWNGRAVVVGFAAGQIPKIPANVLLVKNVSVAGLFWGAHLQHDPRTLLRSATQLISWWADGSIRPHVCERVPLSRAHDAFDLLESRKSTGKVVLVPDS